MIVVSDYSGQHKDALYEAYAFLVTNDRALSSWLPILADFQRQWLPDGRRLSFKKLNEPMRRRSLPFYLETMGKLKGNLVTVLVDRRVGSFMSGGPSAAIEALPDCFGIGTKHGTVEKMLRLASFLALILAGLRREDQVSHWISDHDEALDTDEKREAFGRLATYMTFGLARWTRPANNWFGTTELPNMPSWSEDVAALPDLIAGAYCQLADVLPKFFGEPTWQIKVSPTALDWRAEAIGNWLARRRDGDLRHVLLRVEAVDGGDVKTSAQTFLGH